LSRTTTTIVASQGQSKNSKKSKIAQPGTKLHEDTTSSSQASDARSASKTVSRSSTGYTQDVGQEAEPPHIPLTTQALQDHNIQQDGFFQMLKSQHTSQQCNVTNGEAVVNAADDPTYVMDVPGRDEYGLDSLSWNRDSNQDPTAWGNDLAGVGEHLGTHSCQEYTFLDGFVEE
jgi:hypothetical protein